jgi:RHS repeat-associated protein
LGIHSTTATYDALGRMVEIGSGRTYTQFAYRPDGVLLALYSSEPVKTTIPLPGGSTAIYNSTGLDYIRHTDWLGSSRLATTWNHTVYSKEAYAPFGETYNEAGTPDRSFTGQDQDVVTGSAGTGIYDFLFRKYDPSAGRWLSPDPYGWGAVDLTAPQSLNRYAYVMNNALSYVDPLGYKLCQTIAVNAKGSESGFDPTWCGYYYYQNWGEGGGGGSGGGSGGRGGGGGGGPRGGASSSGSNSNFDPTDPGYQLAVAFQQNGTYTITDWRFIPSFYGASLAGAGALVAAPAVGAAASSGASYIANASGMLGPAAGRIF